MRNGCITLMDEIHTPDSSRYFYSEGYEEGQASGEQQKQLSKEFVREWLMENGFMGKEGQTMPDMPTEFIELVTTRYIELYEKISGDTFEKANQAEIEDRVFTNVEKFLEKR